MLKSCVYCHKIHDSKIQCKAKSTKIFSKNRTAKDRFRSSIEWQETRAYIQERDHHLCQCCLNGIHGPVAYTYDNTSVHHIAPLEEAWQLRLSEDNLITLCNRHHEAAEAGRITRQVLRDLVSKKNF